MKKKLFLSVCALLAFTALHGTVIVKQGDQVVSYKDGAVVYIDGSVNTLVHYNGMNILVPQGTALRVAETNGSVSLSGSNLQGVQLLGLTVQSQGKTTLLANPATRTVSVREGSMRVTNQSGRTAIVNSGYKVTVPAPAQPVVANRAPVKQVTARPAAAQAQSPAAPQEGVDFTVLEEFVATDFSNVNFQQAVEDQTLSPSAPSL